VMMVMYQSAAASAVKSSRHVMNVMVTAALRRRQTVRRVMTLTAEPLPHCYPLLLLPAPIRQIRVVSAARGRSAAIATQSVHLQQMQHSITVGAVLISPIRVEYPGGSAQVLRMDHHPPARLPDFRVSIQVVDAGRTACAAPAAGNAVELSVDGADGVRLIHCIRRGFARHLPPEFHPPAGGLTGSAYLHVTVMMIYI